MEVCFQDRPELRLRLKVRLRLTDRTIITVTDTTTIITFTRTNKSKGTKGTKKNEAIFTSSQTERGKQQVRGRR